MAFECHFDIIQFYTHTHTHPNKHFYTNEHQFMSIFYFIFFGTNGWNFANYLNKKQTNKKLESFHSQSQNAVLLTTNNNDHTNTMIKLLFLRCKDPLFHHNAWDANSHQYEWVRSLVEPSLLWFSFFLWFLCIEAFSFHQMD